jgi:hypothetical protein
MFAGNFPPNAVGRAICALGRQDPPAYWSKPSAKAQRVQEQLGKYGTVRVVDVEDALNQAAQQKLITVERRLLSVEAPDWLHITERRTPVIAPRPRFEPL